MYWIFLLLFITAVLVPDVIRGQVYFVAEERAEEILIFVLGMIAFLTFINNERKIARQKKEQEKAEKKIDQTVRDLVDSYSYIGEVNRKMDILMGVALGLSDRSTLDKKKEHEIYLSILNASMFLLKAEEAMIRFVNMKTGRTEKEIKLPETGKMTVANKILTGMKENINLKKQRGSIIISSSQKINGIGCFLVAHSYDENEENKPKNIEILKLFASQAMFLYSYMTKSDK